MDKKLIQKDKSKNKIAMVVYSTYPADSRVRREAEALVDFGCAVDIYCLSNNGDTPQEIVNGVTIYRSRLIKRPRGKLMLGCYHTLFLVETLIKLSLQHLKKRYRVIHIHNVPDILVLSALIPWLMQSKIILDMHEITPEFFMRKFHVSEKHLLVKLLKLLEIIAVRLTSQVIVATPFLHNIVTARSVIPGKCTTILNLPDSKFFDAVEKKNYHLNGRFKIVYPGTLSEQHGVDIAIKAVQLVKTKVDIPVEFHIYGPTLEHFTLRPLIQKLDLQDNVFLHPLIGLDRLVPILTTMDVGIVPKRDGVFIGEAISTKLFEYAAIGLPAVVSKTAGDSLYFDDSMVLFFEPENEHDLAQKLIELIKNQDLRFRLAQTAKHMFERLNWQIEKAKLLSVYHKIGLQ